MTAIDAPFEPEDGAYAVPGQDHHDHATTTTMITIMTTIITMITAMTITTSTAIITITNGADFGSCAA